MKTIFYLLLCVLLICCFSLISYAENYESKIFPSDQTLSKMFNKKEKSRVFYKSIGKQKTIDNSYKVFFLYKFKGSEKQAKGIMVLTGLDNGLWIFNYRIDEEFFVLEK